MGPHSKNAPVASNPAAAMIMTLHLRPYRARTDLSLGCSINELVMLDLDAGRGLWHTIRFLPGQRKTRLTRAISVQLATVIGGLTVTPGPVKPAGTRCKSEGRSGPRSRPGRCRIARFFRSRRRRYEPPRQPDRVRKASAARTSCGAPQRRWSQLCFAVTVVVWVDRHPRRDELVDPVEDVRGQGDLGAGQLGLQLLHGARADDRGSNGRMIDDERDGQLDEGQAGLVGQPREFFDDFQLAL